LREKVGNFSRTTRSFTRLSEGEVFPLVFQLNKWIKDDYIPDPDFADYEITQAILDHGHDMARKYADSIADVSNMEIEKSGAVELLDSLAGDLKAGVKQLDRLVRHFRTSNPDFYNGFKAVKLFDNTGVRHNVIKGKVTLHGQPVAGAEIICSKVNKSVTTDLNGEFIYPPVRAGLRQFFCTAPGHAPVPRVITVLKGKLTPLNWEFPKDFISEAEKEKGSRKPETP
jgi:hypothetical protein